MKDEFIVKHKVKPRIKNPILIEGLPGIGNVGKIAMDFIIENLKAKEMAKIYSHSFPHTVFLNENNLVDLPAVTLYYKRINGKDYIFLGGDVQPVNETACYRFCDLVLDIVEEFGCKEVVTLGGIALNKLPKNPKVFVTGNDINFVKSFKGASNEIYGIVGPIIGVSGLLLGLGSLRDMKTAALLTQTYGHPSYFGVKGSRESLKVLEKRFRLGVNVKKLSDEIEEIEEEIKTKAKQMDEIKSSQENKVTKNLSYFG